MFIPEATSIQKSGVHYSGVDSRGAGGARAQPEFGCSEKMRSLIFANWSFAIRASTSGFKKLSMALTYELLNL